MRTIDKIPDSTRSSLHQRLSARARERRPQIDRIQTRFRAGFAYIDTVLPGGDVPPRCRLCYADAWGFAMYCVSHGDYQKLPPTHRPKRRYRPRRPRHGLRPLPGRPHRPRPGPPDD